MLEALEKAQEELKLKRWMDIQVEDISECLTQIQKFSKTSFQKAVKSLTEIEDDLVVVSNELSAVIAGLQSKQLATQTDTFALLDDILTTDSDKRSFIHGGGISALLQLLGSDDEKVVQKSLEILQLATYFGSFDCTYISALFTRNRIWKSTQRAKSNFTCWSYFWLYSIIKQKPQDIRIVHHHEFTSYQRQYVGLSVGKNLPVPAQVLFTNTSPMVKEKKTFYSY